MPIIGNMGVRCLGPKDAAATVLQPFKAIKTVNDAEFEEDIDQFTVGGRPPG